MVHDVFIGHAHKDKSVADAICERLESAGVRCWIAGPNIWSVASRWSVAIFDPAEPGIPAEQQDMGAAQHTKGWQTAVMGDAPESAPRGEAQGGLQPDSAKVAAAVKPEPSPDSQVNATSWSSAHSYYFARVIRSKIHNIRHRSLARLRFVDVKMRLIALWDQSLARSQRPRSWTGFWNSNKGEGRKLASPPKANH